MFQLNRMRSIKDTGAGNLKLYAYWKPIYLALTASRAPGNTRPSFSYYSRQLRWLP